MLLHDQKHQNKNLNILRTKTAFNMKSKGFFITFKELSLKQIKPAILEGESPMLRLFYDINLLVTYELVILLEMKKNK